MNDAAALRVAIAQLNLLVGDIDGNATRIIDTSAHARDTLQADMVVFPELTLTGYPPEDLLLRPGMQERVAAAVERIRTQVRGITVVFGYPRSKAGALYNSVAMLRDGEFIAQGDKQHLPNYSVFDEKRYFVAGRDRCVGEVKDCRVGVVICEDVWESGPVAEVVAAGAQLVLNINASPFHVDKGNEREAVVGRRARESGVPLIYVNLVGGQDELVFDGESFAVDADGEVVCRFPAYAEGLYTVDFTRRGEDLLPRAQDEPAEALSTDASIYQALVTGVRDYVTKNGFEGVVIGLSGGIDSALTLAVAVDALGAEVVEAVMLPSRYTAAMSREDAATEAHLLGVEYHEISIDSVYQAFLDALADEFTGYGIDTTEENIQARCRGVILMAISNKKHKMVLTTGNKSEMAVGYATLYGDMAGGFCVLKDVSKTRVYRLVEYRNRIAPVIPQRVIERPPSAELAPDQKDSDSLPPYDILDPILRLYVEQDQGVEDIVAAGFDADTVRRVVRMVDRNEYKRRQAPPGVRITRRAFGRDRRYPITSAYGRDR